MKKPLSLLLNVLLSLISILVPYQTYSQDTNLLNCPDLINLVRPEIVCISGGISNAPDRLFFDPLVEFIQQRAYAPVAARVKVVKSALGDDAPMIGASMLHLSH
jgi:hypothetical protein